MGARMDKIKGKAKQIEGRLTGDKTRSAQGTAEKAKGDAEGIGERVVRKAKGAVRDLKGRARASPNARARR
jgi:uncharacterized protein YjbJ (UPF0337 family)